MAIITKDRKGNQQAYREALKALEKDRIDEVKTLVKSALEELQKADQARRQAVDKIQTIKRDLEDLKAGRLDKIKERHEKDKQADAMSPITPAKIEKISHLPTAYSITAGSTTAGAWSNMDYQTTGRLWQNAVSGTYVMDNGSVKSI